MIFTFNGQNTYIFDLDRTGKALVLIARNGTGGLICMYVGIESGRP